MTETRPDNNALFNRKLLQKTIAASDILKNGEIPDKHKKIIEKRLSNLALHKKQKERTLSPDFLNFFKDLLGYKSTGDLSHAKTWDIETELKGIDYALGEFAKDQKTVIVPFELKGPDTYDLTRPMKGRKESTIEQATRYALNHQATTKWLLVSNCLEFRLYKFPDATGQFEQWHLDDLLKPADYARFVLLLSKKNLLGGFTEKLYTASQQAQKAISDQLYQDYRQLRIDLINGLKRENNTIRRKTMVRISQKLLDRMLFIAFAEDRGLLPANTLQERIFNDPSAGFSVWEVIKKLFTDIDKGNAKLDIPAYNGGLFAPDPDVDKLNVSLDLLKKFKTLYDYDFDNDIGTPVLGHIFEQSIADLDEIYEAIHEDQELQGNAKTTSGTQGKRKQDGIVYTPEFITDYLIKHTLGGYLAQRKTSIPHPPDSPAYWLAYRDILATTRVLDPACGSGAFLIGAFKYLKAEYHFINQRINELDTQHGDLFGLDLDANILNNNLFGVDLNAESIEITQLALWLETAEKGKKLRPLDENIRQGNSIIHHKHTDKQAFLWTIHFKKVLDGGGFDVILGNPPYVRQERLSAIKPYLQEHYQTYHGMADLYTYFFELGLGLLKKGGRLGYISSSTFFRTNSGTLLREFLKVQSNFLTVIDFNDYPVFEGVTTYPAILVLEKPERLRKQPPKSDFSFLNVTAKKVPHHSALLQQLQSEFGVMKQATLQNEAWQLEDARFTRLRQKITKNNKDLKDVYGSPYRGVLTGLNEAFVIDTTQYAHLKADDPEGKILKPFLEGKDLKRWRAESRGLYLILFPKGWTHQQLQHDEGDPALTESAAWEHVQRYYPNIAAHLHPFAAQGRKRGDKGDFWWELRACAYYDAFEKPKIVYPDLSQGPKFHLDQAGCLFPNTGYFIASLDKYLPALLNSNVVWFFLKGISDAMKGGEWRIRLFSQNIERIPIPAATPEQKQTLADLAGQCQTEAEQRYALEQKVQRRLLENLRPADNTEPLNTKLAQWWQLAGISELANEARKAFKLKKSETLKTDLTKLAVQDEWETYLQTQSQQWQTHTQTIHALERQINTTIYILFKLSPEEIQLIEHN
jgi:type I restriction-modification system DNA methylase subunit